MSSDKGECKRVKREGKKRGGGGVRIRVSKSVPGYAPAAVSHALAGGVSGAAGTGKSKATRLRVTQSSSHFVTNRKHFTFFPLFPTLPQLLDRDGAFVVVVPVACGTLH